MNIDGTIGNKYQPVAQTRPYDFGTDAIERQRVSLGSSLIDADFEYGLQATKWQTYQEVRKTPSFYEIPGTDVSVSSITQDTSVPAVMTVITASTPVATPTLTYGGGSGTSAVVTLSAYTNVAVGQQVIVAGISGLVIVSAVNGTSNITIIFPLQTVGPLSGVQAYFYSSIVPLVGTVINISGLANAAGDANRAEGFFLVNTVTSQNPYTFTYKAKGAVSGTSTSSSTAYTVLRRGGIYNNGACKIQVSGYTQAGGTGTAVTVTTTAAHGITPGTPITITGTGSDGNYLANLVPSSTTFSYVPPGVVGSYTASANFYIQPYAYTVHRPFDGGVLLSPNIPTHGGLVARQSKKVFRYQSGKGLLWSSGTLFCPNNDIVSLTYSAGQITVTTSVPHGAPQAGAVVQIRGVASSGYNGTFTVASVTGDTVIVLNTTTVPTVSPAALGDQPRFVMTNWHGASVRAGCFDDQNGLFWEYDGQTLWVVKRSCTFQLAGSVTVNTNSQTLVGSGTRFLAQLKVNDKFTVRGMTHTVTGIATDTSLTFNPPFRGSANITVGVTACKVKELRVPQNQFNRDTIDGNGASGFRVDLTRMQMIGLQYTWYGAGFVDFMMRGGDGNWVYVHRFRNNNVNDEAYMRTGNMPVRYEIVNESVSAASTLAAIAAPTLPVGYAGSGGSVSATVLNVSNVSNINTTQVLTVPSIIGNPTVTTVTPAVTTTLSGAFAGSTSTNSITLNLASVTGLVAGQAFTLNGLTSVSNISSITTSPASTTLVAAYPGTNGLTSSTVLNLTSLTGLSSSQVVIVPGFSTTTTISSTTAAGSTTLSGTYTTTGRSSNSNTFTLASASGIIVGQALTIAGVTSPILVTGINGNTVTVSYPDQVVPTLTNGTTVNFLAAVTVTVTPAQILPSLAIGTAFTVTPSIAVTLTPAQVVPVIAWGSIASFYPMLTIGTTSQSIPAIPTGSVVTVNTGTSDTTLLLNDTTTYWPSSGVVLVDSETISYSGKTANSLTGCLRANVFTYNIADNNVRMQGAAAAATHLVSNSVNLISCSCSPSMTHWGSALLMDGTFDTDRGYFFNYQVNNIVSVNAGATRDLFMLRLAPSVSNGVVGDIGNRELLNRAQLLLQRLDVFAASASTSNIASLVVSGILNPSGVSASAWTAVNSSANGSQPSFAQVSAVSGTYLTGSGERIFSTIANNGQNSIDLSTLKEICNSTIGGNQFFPDGPDTLLVQLSVPAGFQNVAAYSVNLFWTEAQA